MDQADEQEALEKINVSLRMNLEEVLQASQVLEQQQLEMETERNELAGMLRGDLWKEQHFGYATRSESSG